MRASSPFHAQRSSPGSRASALAATVLVITFAATALAGDGRIPVYALVPPATITLTQPGSYYLTDDIDYSALVGDALVISADNVTLDLDGHTITGHTGAGATGATISVTNRTGVRITNGTIRGNAQGVKVVSTTLPVVSCTLDSLRVLGQVAATSTALSFSSPSSAFRITPAIEDIVVECSAAGTGIDIVNGLGGRIQEVTLWNCGTGIKLTGSENDAVTRCAIAGGYDGIVLWTGTRYAQIADNTIASQGAGSSAILLYQTIGCTVSRNTVTGDYSGIHLVGATRSNVDQNHSSSSNCGIVIEAPSTINVITNNRAPGSTGCSVAQACGSNPATAVGISDTSGGGNTICFNLP